MNKQQSEKKLLSRIFITFLVGLTIGGVMAIVSNGFVYGVRWLANKRENLDVFQFQVFGWSASVAPLICLLVAAVAVLIIKRLFSMSRYHGPADSIYAAHRADHEPEWKSGIGSTLAAFVSASGGASVGQYGPLVHFGATVGGLIKRLTGGVLSTEIFLGCGVAGAIAAGFNAPITGLVFAHEAILRHFSQKAIAPIAISSITAAAISEWAFGNTHVFTLDQAVPEMVELLPVLLISGPIFGFVAIVFMTSLRRSAQFAASGKVSPTNLVLMAAIICGCVGMFIPEILGLGTGAVNQMFENRFELNYLFLLLVAKILMTAVCIGFGLFGGVFSPALFVGASAGGIFGKLLTMFGIGSGGASVLAVCGMAAVGAAIIGAPISTVLIVLEMTMSYEFAVVAMLSVVTCKIVSNVFYGHSFFDRQLLDRGIDIAQGRAQISLMDAKVKDYLERDEYLKFEPGTSNQDAIKEMSRKVVTESYVVDINDKFVGKILLHSLVNNKAGKVEELIEKNPIVIDHDSSVLEAIQNASQFVGESMPVVDRVKDEMIGIMTEANLLQAYLKLQNRVRDIEAN